MTPAAFTSVLLALAFPACVHAQDAAALREREASLAGALAANPFHRPLVIESRQSRGTLEGDVYAVVAYPYAVVGPALQGMDHWCDILLVHLNVKGCVARGAGDRSVLSLAVGRRFDQPLADAFRIDFAYRVAASTPGYLEVLLTARAGPLGTKDYRIVVEAAPVDAKSSFIHMSYSYAYGVAAEVAMRGYLATLGRDKVGFTIVARDAGGAPVFLGDVRGVIERNTMRYYLAIEGYLAASGLPPAQQPERRLENWFAAVERYPRQLHEMERGEYLSM
ncbi:MAG TPA: hypothetical protein VFO24_10620, partial [Usitatibacter sp.]|nr:hypothetical protein [Usitatibacter sp.]